MSCLLSEKVRLYAGADGLRSSVRAWQKVTFLQKIGVRKKTKVKIGFESKICLSFLLP